VTSGRAPGKEVAPLGIYVTAIEPGPFRTDWSGRSMVHSPRSIHDYEEFYEPIREARGRYNGQQPGPDPDRCRGLPMAPRYGRRAPGTRLRPR
jgi:NAD(P)-dependent dehydrogenase (short-subunit alcohol dehydrogenase family)